MAEKLNGPETTSEVSPIDAVRRAVRKLGPIAPKSRLQSYVKEHFGLKLSADQVMTLREEVLREPLETTVPMPETPEPNGVDTVQDSARTQTSQPANKKEAVLRAMATGLTMPVEVAKYLKDHFNITITPAHVSTIKGNLKKDKGVIHPPRKRGRKPKNQSAQQSEPRRSETPVVLSTGLNFEDLTALASIAKRAGGLAELQQFLSALERMR